MGLTIYGVLASKLSILILDCRMLFGQEWNVLPRHIFREANGVANELAERGRKHQYSVREYNECPNFVYVKYVCDILQLGTPCKCPINNTCNCAP